MVVPQQKYEHITFQDDPTLVFALHGLGSLIATMQEIEKALQYYKMVIDCVNGIILSGDKSIISSSMCDIYSEYVILHAIHKLDLKKAKEDVNIFFSSINKHLQKNAGELIYILKCKPNIMWIFQDYEECLSALRKVIKLIRKNKELIKEERGMEVANTLYEPQILYQIAKGIYILFDGEINCPFTMIISYFFSSA